jgi:hypothetical protein
VGGLVAVRPQGGFQMRKAGKKYTDAAKLIEAGKAIFP